ncbi:MAG: hypothetical protein AAGA56_00570 [Myxococcota bacterium]
MIFLVGCGGTVSVEGDDASSCPSRLTVVGTVGDRDVSESTCPFSYVPTVGPPYLLDELSLTPPRRGSLLLGFGEPRPLDRGTEARLDTVVFDLNGLGRSQPVCAGDGSSLRYQRDAGETSRWELSVSLRSLSLLAPCAPGDGSLVYDVSEGRIEADLGERFSAEGVEGGTTLAFFDEGEGVVGALRSPETLRRSYQAGDEAPIEPSGRGTRAVIATTFRDSLCLASHPHLRVADHFP